MYKYIIFLFSFGFILGLDQDWISYEGHEVSLNSIIIKIDDTEYSYSDLKRDKSMGSLTKQYYNLNLIK